jgi:hypothetical protein
MICVESKENTLAYISGCYSCKQRIVFIEMQRNLDLLVIIRQGVALKKRVLAEEKADEVSSKF